MAFWGAFKPQVSWAKLALGEIKQRFLPSSRGVFNKLPMNPYERFKKTINVSNKKYTFFDLPKIGDKYNQLPFSNTVLLDSFVRNVDNFQATENDVQNILKWKTNQTIEGGVEVAFIPARVILQDFTGVPAVVDFAAMRDAVKSLGGDPGKINPVCPSDLVIDHSIQADFVREADAQQKNENLEFQRNKERFTFLKSGAKAFKNMLIVPPGSCIVHQVNLEYLARVVFIDRDKKIENKIQESEMIKFSKVSWIKQVFGEIRPRCLQTSPTVIGRKVAGPYIVQCRQMSTTQSPENNKWPKFIFIHQGIGWIILLMILLYLRGYNYGVDVVDVKTLKKYEKNNQCTIINSIFQALQLILEKYFTNSASDLKKMEMVNNGTINVYGSIIYNFDSAAAAIEHDCNPAREGNQTGQ